MKSEPENPINSVKLRRKAEEKLRLKRKTNPLPDLSEVDTRRLLHELEVHQIELEMQNEELHQIQAALEASRLLYFDLFDLAPVGYLILDKKNTIQEANFTVSALLGLDRGELNKQPITHFILPEDQDIFYRHCQILFEKKYHRNLIYGCAR
jgi:PAS domain-containing protein